MCWGGKGWIRRVTTKRELDKKGENKDVSGGTEPGVRGFEEDSREMDRSEECGVSLGESARPDPWFSALLCRAAIILASASVH